MIFLKQFSIFNLLTIAIRRNLYDKFVPKICPKKFFPKILKNAIAILICILNFWVFLRSIDSKIYRRSEFLLNGLFGRLTYLSPVLLLISNLTNELHLHQFLVSKTMYLGEQVLKNWCKRRLLIGRRTRL